MRQTLREQPLHSVNVNELTGWHHASFRVYLRRHVPLTVESPPERSGLNCGGYARPAATRP
ncbi:MAG: hypothetical protein EB117_15795, partial [Betaproteobacteria bacterium]|nr:hypothetical protein [Betaproteobacteria bacterium]